MKYPTWTLRTPCPQARGALERDGMPSLTAAVLSARGIRSTAEAEAFLATGTEGLCDPFTVTDIDRAADRIRQALDRREIMAVYGDYDVDGITATCLLTGFLREQGGRCLWYIPDRIEEGYGLNCDAIRRLRSRGVTLIITVDCGVTANDVVDCAAAMGLDVVVTDHHACKEPLPTAEAVVDPHRPDETAAFTELAGVGVALKLALALTAPEARPEVFRSWCDLAALGTVADVVPLVGENRIITARGLEELNRARRTGIRALLREAHLVNRPLTSISISYTLAPRLNAAGRMGRADVAAELLLTEDEERARALAAELTELNRDRQLTEQDIYREALARIEAQGGPGSAVVLSDDNWHQGVVGIVASRLAERFFCPVFMICTDGDRGKGSCRSGGRSNIYDMLNECTDCLESFGGHDMAAGFTIRRDRIDEFRTAVQACARAAAQETDAGVLELDAEVEGESLTLPAVEALEVLEPHGAANPQPMFLLRQVHVLSCCNVGGERHLRLRMEAGGCPVDGIFFSTTDAEQDVRPGDLLDLAFCPKINEYNGSRTVQLVLSDLRPAETADPAERALYDAWRRGTWSDEEGASLLPSREEFEAVWRFLAREKEPEMETHAETLARRVAAAYGLEPSPARTCVCLTVFRELGLLEELENLPEGGLRLRRRADPPRTRLDSSALFRRLTACAGGAYYTGEDTGL